MRRRPTGPGRLAARVSRRLRVVRGAAKSTPLFAYGVLLVFGASEREPKADGRACVMLALDLQFAAKPLHALVHGGQAEVTGIAGVDVEAHAVVAHREQ